MVATYLLIKYIVIVNVNSHVRFKVSIEADAMCLRSFTIFRIHVGSSVETKESVGGHRRHEFNAQQVLFLYYQRTVQIEVDKLVIRVWRCGHYKRCFVSCVYGLVYRTESYFLIFQNPTWRRVTLQIKISEVFIP